MIEQLPALIGATGSGALTPLCGGSLVPALIADRRRASRLALRRILHRQHPQPEHAPGLCAGCNRFFAWCEERGLTLTTIRPYRCRHLYRDTQLTHSAPDVKQQLAAVRMLFDWLITGQVMP